MSVTSVTLPVRGDQILILPTAFCFLLSAFCSRPSPRTSPDLCRVDQIEPQHAVIVKLHVVK